MKQCFSIDNKSDLDFNINRMLFFCVELSVHLPQIVLFRSSITITMIIIARNIPPAAAPPAMRPKLPLFSEKQQQEVFN